MGSNIDRRALFDIIRRDREVEIAASADHDDLDEALADLARLEASNRRRLESGRALLRDALSYEQPGHRLRQVRESALRYEMPPPIPSNTTHREDESRRPELVTWGNFSTIPRAEERRSPPPQYMPTPPYAPGESAEQTPLPTPLAPASLIPLSTSSRDMPSLTTGFPPAWRYEDPRAALEEEARILSRGNPLMSRHGYMDDHPPLRRNRHRLDYDYENEHAPAMTINRVDGLGDRRRSFSPEEATWETLLTTIAPDERLPSTDSSFTSATISSSSRSSNSMSSSATLLTAPSSSSETLNAMSNICDDPTDSECSGSDDEVATVMRDGFHDGPSLVDPLHYTSSVRTRARRQSRQIDDTFERLRRRANQEIEYQQMQTMMARMDRHEPIPDEWWATAGLSRSVSGRVERTERERL